MLVLVQLCVEQVLGVCIDILCVGGFDMKVEMEVGVIDFVIGVFDDFFGESFFQCCLFWQDYVMMFWCGYVLLEGKLMLECFCVVLYLVVVSLVSFYNVIGLLFDKVGIMQLVCFLVLYFVVVLYIVSMIDLVVMVLCKLVECVVLLFGLEFVVLLFKLFVL